MILTKEKFSTDFQRLNIVQLTDNWYSNSIYSTDPGVTSRRMWGAGRGFFLEHGIQGSVNNPCKGPGATRLGGSEEGGGIMPSPINTAAHNEFFYFAKYFELFHPRDWQTEHVHFWKWCEHKAPLCTTSTHVIKSICKEENHVSFQRLNLTAKHRFWLTPKTDQNP